MAVNHNVRRSLGTPLTTYWLVFFWATLFPNTFLKAKLLSKGYRRPTKTGDGTTGSAIGSPVSKSLMQSAPNAYSIQKQKVAAPTLESLCRAKDDKQRSEYAAKINAMWADVKNKNIESDYRTACTAVYKVAEWLELGGVYNQSHVKAAIRQQVAK
jgi:hypothetical protein